MTTRQIVALFKGKRSSKGKWAARCPAHRDRGPSLIISERPNGSTGVHCFAGCDVHDVLGAVGLRLHDLFPDEKPNREALALADKLRIAVPNGCTKGMLSAAIDAKRMQQARVRV